MEIASRFQNVRIEQREFIGFGPTKNLAAELASHNWILSIDSDEVITPQLSSEIKSLPLDDGKVYRFSRHSYYKGRFIKGCGWYPDKILRLYNKQRTGLNDNQVHESVMVKGRDGCCRSDTAHSNIIPMTALGAWWPNYSFIQLCLPSRTRESSSHLLVRRFREE